MLGRLYLAACALVGLLGPALGQSAALIGPNDPRFCTGTIASASDTITCDVTGTSSANFTVQGTFVGTIAAAGSPTATAPLGGRILFRAGIGSLAVNTIANTGVAIAKEYRLLTGGTRIVFSAPAWTSGSATITLTATPNSSLTFINGPVHNYIEEAGRAQRAFVATTTTAGVAPTVANGSFLNVVFCNTSASTFVTVYKRRFDGNVVSGAAPMSYGGISNPAPIASPTVTTNGSNLFSGGPASTAVTMTAAVSTTRLNNAANNAVPTASGFIPVNGEPLKLEEARFIPPGVCFGNYVVGQNQSTAFGSGAASANATFYWTEEPM